MAQNGEVERKFLPMGKSCLAKAAKKKEDNQA
jgi:hypothetical protein